MMTYCTYNIAHVHPELTVFGRRSAATEGGIPSTRLTLQTLFQSIFCVPHALQVPLAPAAKKGRHK